MGHLTLDISEQRQTHDHPQNSTRPSNVPSRCRNSIGIALPGCNDPGASCFHVEIDTTPGIRLCLEWRYPESVEAGNHGSELRVASDFETACAGARPDQYSERSRPPAGRHVR